MSWDNYYHPNIPGKKAKTKDPFNIDTYREAQRCYNLGASVLFETELL